MVRVRLGDMPLRIVVWNCNMALHRKWNRLVALRPDIAVVPESAKPEIMRRKAPDFAFSDCEWDGWNEHQGLAVFSFGEYTLGRGTQDRQYQIFTPLKVRGPHPLHLLAVWAFSPVAPFRAVTNSPSIRTALAHYAPFLSSTPSVVAGDFNSSTIWDTPGGPSNHAESVADLRALGLESAYHVSTGCSSGAEREATLFHGRNIASCYHIDYCFAPTSWQGRSARVTVGRPEDWLTVSDHMPVVVELEPSAATGLVVG
jgi:exodeoxyribonuclease III